jgi:hypothetical protein
MAWVACVASVTLLGLSGILAEGCGDDDTTPPPGTAGSGGGGGTGGKASTTNTGGGGSTGGGGTSGGTAGTGGNMDAGIDAQAVCNSAIMSGSACTDKCICDSCATRAVACFADSRCRNLVDCGNRMMCANADPTLALQCVMQKCPGEYAEAGTGLQTALQFAGCITTANCGVKCAPEGGVDGGGDAPKADAPSDTTTQPDQSNQPDGPNLPDQANQPDHPEMPDHPEPPDSPPGQD